MVSKPPSNASILQLYTFMVSSFSSVLCTLGPHFYVFPACSAFPKGIFETFISLLKPSVYPPSCSVPAHDFDFLLTEKRDSVILSCSAPLLIHKPISFHCLPACLLAVHLSILFESLLCHDFCDNVCSWFSHFSGHSFSLWFVFSFTQLWFFSILLAPSGSFQCMKLIISPPA